VASEEAPPGPAPAVAEPDAPPEPALVASVPPESDRPEPLSPAVEQFLDDWSRAIEEVNYRLYKRLGFKDSRRKFSRRYKGHEDRSVRFEQAVLRNAPSGDLQLSVVMIYSYAGGAGKKVQLRTRRIVLRETDEGLQYVEAWSE
jgi:hypothetical protein